MDVTMDKVDHPQTPISKLLQPVRVFMGHSASSGLVLVGVTILALFLANTGLASSYNDVLHTPISLTIGGFSLSYSLLHWINDGLMAIFFLFVGLEIKREVLFGELSTRRAAMLPVVAAIGGAIVPALLYVLLNQGGAGVNGWGIPMATDIAFTLGLLALLGKRVPVALKIFVTAVAIVDDLIAILVIALFYSDGINFGALGLGMAILAVMFAGNLLGVRRLLFYLGLGVLVWVAFLQSGVHATIAGVLIALTIPARTQNMTVPFLSQVRRLIDSYERSESIDDSKYRAEFQQELIAEIETLSERAEGPLQRLEHALQPWVAFLIMPVFALANAGVTLSLNGLEGDTARIAVGIVVGLVIGKPLGLLGASWLAIRSKLAVLPSFVTTAHLIGASCLAGIGFTMSLFIASLGLDSGAQLTVAKLGILVASLVAGVIGFMMLGRLPPVNEEQG